MSRRQRDKGAYAERELADLIRDELGVRMARNLGQTRDGGHDLIVLPAESGACADALRRYAIESKRYASASPSIVASWWDQAESQARLSGLVPILAYRFDRRPWRVVVPLSELRTGMTRAAGIEYTAEMSIPAFCAIIREAIDKC